MRHLLEGIDEVRVGDPPVGGRYSLVEPFGADERFAGGKVRTWRAQDSLVDRPVVLRVITPGGNSARLFLDRAHEMSLIAHPGLGMVYEAVDHTDYAIVVCEWIDGTSLAATLAAHGPLTPRLARQTLGQVAEAIAVAHHAGLPIGGITAERVVLRDNGSVTVTGVPALFADERGDIQQLGTLLYSALTGEEPALEDPELAKKLPRGVPRDLAVLCQRALDNDPARQLGSAAAFAAVLRPRAKPQSPAGGTAGRTTDRIAGLDGAPLPKVHDTSPARVPRASKAATAAGATRTAATAAPGPTSSRAEPVTSAEGGPAKSAKARTTRAKSNPATKTIPTSRATPTAQPIPAYPPAPATQAIPTVRSTAARRSAAAPKTPQATGPTAPAQTTAFASGPSTAAPPTSPTSPTRPTSPTPPTQAIPTRPTQAIPTRPRAAARSTPTVWDAPSASAAAPTEPPAHSASPDAPAAAPLRRGRAVREQPKAPDERDSPIHTSEDFEPWSDDTGAWGTYDDSDDPEADSYEGGQTRRKVLLYAVPVAALILIILMTVIVGKQLNAVVSGNNGPAVVPSSEQPAPTTTPPEDTTSESATSSEPVAAAPLQLVSAAVFNPFGDGGPEHSDDVGLSHDGDPATAWKTLTYQSSPEFGNLKPGVGVIFDLGEEHSITSLELATSLPGSAVEIRVGAAPDAALESYPVIGTLDPFTDNATVALAEPVRARFVIVWFVRLVEANGGFQGALAECRILGT